ncbi:site-2 protease family protein [Pyrobaculum neutrophilum]|uniref:Peptidase M50 n=1 Tax=Pyrobaculum neutrophilum (strain DSM 2338 / JCM 9278 / NBRC 100436 / V24Sta) TaxID=444157 RepID=B1YB64_PYRNV|nr:site-2 protease family protein [Pyrobaculum neutrophilum]ACB39195.1 peptidase M50 [Pyrobaculum neutrophilum V24Sta]
MYHELRKRELVDLAVAFATLTVGFSIAIAGGGIVGGINWRRVLEAVPIVAFVLLFAFVGHEMAHRQVARRLGYIAMFQADYNLLPLAVILPLLFGVVFAAPGAVVVLPFRPPGGGNERRDLFYIAAAGPITNIAFGAAGLAIATYTNSPIWWFFAYTNAWLAFFNLLPIPPLDGNKMLRTNLPMWLAITAVAGLLVAKLWQ